MWPKAKERWWFQTTRTFYNVMRRIEVAKSSRPKVQYLKDPRWRGCPRPQAMGWRKGTRRKDPHLRGKDMLMEKDLSWPTSIRRISQSLVRWKSRTSSTGSRPRASPFFFSWGTNMYLMWKIWRACCERFWLDRICRSRETTQLHSTAEEKFIISPHNKLWRVWCVACWPFLSIWYLVHTSEYHCASLIRRRCFHSSEHVR